MIIRNVAFILTLLATVSLAGSISPTHITRGTAGVFNVSSYGDLNPSGCTLSLPSGEKVVQSLRSDTGSVCWFGRLKHEGTYWLSVNYGSSSATSPTRIVVTNKTAFTLSGSGEKFYQGYGTAFAMQASDPSWAGGRCPVGVQATTHVTFDGSSVQELPTSCTDAGGKVIFYTGDYDFITMPDSCTDTACNASIALALGGGKRQVAGYVTVVPPMSVKTSSLQVDSQTGSKLCLKAAPKTKNGDATGLRRRAIWGPKCHQVSVTGTSTFCCTIYNLTDQDQFSIPLYVSAVFWSNVSVQPTDTTVLPQVSQSVVWIGALILVLGIVLVGGALSVLAMSRWRLRQKKSPRVRKEEVW
jgi:hypothetical protein